MRQATFHATITDTTPGIVTALLARAGGDPASAETGPAPTTSSNTASGFTRLPIGSLGPPPTRRANADFHAGGSGQLSGELVADGAPLPPGDRGGGWQVC